MTSSPFTIRSAADLLATFRDSDQRAVLPPEHASYPFIVDHYFAWTESSGVYTYIVFKRNDWETPLGIVLQRNGAGSHDSPAGMCNWCHTMGPSDEIGLLTTAVTRKMTGGTWLCLDLSCVRKVTAKQAPKLFKRIGEFYQRTRIDP